MPVGRTKPVSVILTGFGSPNSLFDISHFLFQIFSDPAASPFVSAGLFMKPLAKIFSIIAAGRSKKRYLSIAHRPTSNQLIAELAESLGNFLEKSGEKSISVMSATRYSDPFLPDVIKRQVQGGAREILVIPLFPHEAAASTGSVRVLVEESRRRHSDSIVNIHMVDSWHDSQELAMAWVDFIREAINSFSALDRDRVHLLFSAHAIPVERGTMFRDPYVAQINESASTIVDLLGTYPSSSIAYQSRAGFGNWTGPDLCWELKRLGSSGIRNCLIVPISFIYDSIETWCDLDMDIIPRAAEFGLVGLKRVSTPFRSPRLVKALATLLREHVMS